MAIFHELTVQSGRGYFLLLARLVWRGTFVLLPHTRQKIIAKLSQAQSCSSWRQPDQLGLDQLYNYCSTTHPPIHHSTNHRWKRYFTFWLRKKIDKNFLKCKNASIKLNIFHAFTGREGRVVDHENQMATVKSLSHKGCQKETAENRNTCVWYTLGLALFTTN